MIPNAMVSKAPTGGYSGKAERPKIRAGREKRISSITIDVSDNGGCTVRTSYRSKPAGIGKKGGPEVASSYVEPDTFTYTSPEEAIDHITTALMGGAPEPAMPAKGAMKAGKADLKAAAADLGSADLDEDAALEDEDLEA